jgi:hypothetical protein
LKQQWYDFTVKYDANQISVFVKSGLERSNTKVFTVAENQIQRGKVGVGTTNLKDT